MHGQLRPGDVIYGDYEVLDLAGVGATSYVYRCRSLKPGMPAEVAVKCLHNKFVFEKRAKEQFLREAALMREIDHPNIVKVYEIIEAPSQIAFVMEHVHGPTLQQWQEDIDGPAGDEDLAQIFLGVLRGVGASHEIGIIHRDLKPANIMLQMTGGRPVTKIIDFGVARKAEAGPDPEDFKMIRGTAAYISPDEIRSPHDVCEQSDLYSLGVILYELAAGQRPFRGLTSKEVLVAHLKEKPLPPRYFNPSITPDLEQVIMRSLAKDPGQRYPDCEHLLAALERAANVSVETTTQVWMRDSQDVPLVVPEQKATRMGWLGRALQSITSLFANPGLTGQKEDPHHLSRPPVEMPVV